MNLIYATEGEMSYDNLFCEGMATEIWLTDLLSGDHIVIETRNSRYEFSVLDPINGHGLLSGGTLGSDAQWAFLVGALDERSDNTSVDTRCLKTDSRALFYLENPLGVKSLILSKVARIIHTRSQRDERLVG